MNPLRWCRSRRPQPAVAFRSGESDPCIVLAMLMEPWDPRYTSTGPSFFIPLKARSSDHSGSPACGCLRERLRSPAATLPGAGPASAATARLLQSSGLWSGYAKQGLDPPRLTGLGRVTPLRTPTQPPSPSERQGYRDAPPNPRRTPASTGALGSFRLRMQSIQFCRCTSLPSTSKSYPRGLEPRISVLDSIWLARSG